MGDKAKWQDIRVGDVIKLCRNDPAPADLALLYTPLVKTAWPLWKLWPWTVRPTSRASKQQLQSRKQSPKRLDIWKADAEFVVEDPNRDLYSFEGRVTVDGKQAPLTLNEVIFRGSILRNTPDAVGVVLYTGEECRIRMNANKNPRTKAPSLQGLVNRIVILIVVFVILLSIFNAVAYKIWQRHERQKWYLSSRVGCFLPQHHFLHHHVQYHDPLCRSTSVWRLSNLRRCSSYSADIDMYDEASNTRLVSPVHRQSTKNSGRSATSSRTRLAPSPTIR